MSEEAPEKVFAEAKASLLAEIELMQRRLRGLVDSKGRVAEEIHAVRKQGKRLRGALAIAGEPKPCIRWLAVIGRMLGSSRDSVVRLATWQSLEIEDKAPGAIESVIESMLAQQAKMGSRRPPREVVDWGLLVVSRVRARVDEIGEEELSTRCEDGAERLKRRLRKRLKRAVARAEDDDFHEARKIVKLWLGGLKVLAPESEPVAAAELDRLADLLGQEHDLWVLGEWLKERGFSTTVASRVWKRLPKVQSRVRRQALTLIRRELLPALKRDA